MTSNHSLRSLLHRATHRIPGIPAHAERPAGHQGTAIRSRGATTHTSVHHGRNHSPARPPRFMPAWQRRIAALFGREL
ncbi:hypothetical protein AB0K00_27330 [Dactylosporangium sp. NPDC049525]|uniref:hypothetical protein n=1 Tax=Dactylosporangium sp. NPDC049525 TaxID=3154730 RepID=UPI003443F059